VCSRLGLSACKTEGMLRSLRLLFVSTTRLFCSRRDLLLENLALRQQLAVLSKRHPKPRFEAPDRLFWVIFAALAWMETDVGPCPARLCRSLASNGIQIVLDMALAKSVPSRKKMREQGIARTHFSHGNREPDLGCASNSW
jgi:hypothetical protein